MGHHLPSPTVLDADRHPERGQASVEYALVLLGAAIIATLLISWATRSHVIDDLFEHIFTLIKGKAS